SDITHGSAWPVQRVGLGTANPVAAAELVGAFFVTLAFDKVHSRRSAVAKAGHLFAAMLALLLLIAAFAARGATLWALVTVFGVSLASTKKIQPTTVVMAFGGALLALWGSLALDMPTLQRWSVASIATDPALVGYGQVGGPPGRLQLWRDAWGR